jgi:hypothetical protein
MAGLLRAVLEKKISYSGGNSTTTTTTTTSSSSSSSSSSSNYGYICSGSCCNFCKLLKHTLNLIPKRISLKGDTLYENVY